MFGLYLPLQKNKQTNHSDHLTNSEMFPLSGMHFRSLILPAGVLHPLLSVYSPMSGHLSGRRVDRAARCHGAAWQPA